VTVAFALVPALNASAVQPFTTLKGGENPHSRQQLMRAMIAVQVAFCFVVVFLGGLLVATFERLSHLSTGFSSERLLVVDATAQRGQNQSWDQVAQRVRSVPGVDSVALAAWPLLDGYTSLGFISINGAPATGDPAYFLNVSPGWFHVMKIPFKGGRDFRASDTYPGAAIVNLAFARRYFSGEDAVGKHFERALGYSRPLEIVGVVRDTRYRDIREPMLPVAYVPLRFADPGGGRTEGTILVRTTRPNPMALASILRTAIPQISPEFRVANIRTQQEIDQSQTVRERLLAMLALFFAFVALLLAGVGLYGVLDYSVLQRRREIGIRMAVGAQASDVVGRVTIDVFSMVLLGAMIGLLLGLASARYIETLLYGVQARDAMMLAMPSLMIFFAAMLAALPAVLRAVNIDPVEILRAG
jgi:predicted permease